MHGWVGKALDIDLSNGAIKTFPTSRLKAENYKGLSAVV